MTDEILSKAKVIKSRIEKVDDILVELNNKTATSRRIDLYVGYYSNNCERHTIPEWLFDAISKALAKEKEQLEAEFSRL